MRPMHVDQAIDRVRSISDPYARLRESDLLDTALVNARSALARIRGETINQVRTPALGYGGIAARLGITKTRVQQLANIPDGHALATYAFRTADGPWHGEPDLLPVGAFQDREATREFSPSDLYNPLAGEQLVFRCGELPSEEGVSLYAVHVKLKDGSPIAVRMTEAVGDKLFGPADTTSAAYKEWQAARESKRREIEGAA